MTAKTTRYRHNYVELAMHDFDIFESELTALLLLDVDGVVTRVSRGWSAILGWPSDGLEGKQLARVCDPEHAERFALALANLASGAPSAVVHAAFPWANQRLELRCRLQPHKRVILLAAEDLADRRTLVQQTANLMRSLVDFAVDAWVVHDLEGRVRDVNASVARSLGYSREELLELHIADLEMTIPRGRLDGVWNRMEIGKPVTVEGRHRRKDGVEFPVEVQLALFESEGGEVLMLAVARDISKRREQDRRLSELNDELFGSNQKLVELNTHLEDLVADRTQQLESTLAERQAILDSLVDGLVAVDEGGLIRVANPALGQLLQAGIAASGTPLSDCAPDALVSLVRRAIDSGENGQVELSLTGDRIGVAVASPITREDGSREGAVALLRDVTVEKQVDRMKTEFIATVSHELRTPLTSVLGFTRMIRNKFEAHVLKHIPETDKRATRAVKQIRGNLDIVISEGTRLTELINNVLDISKMEAGHMEWRSESVNPQELVERAIEVVQGLFTDGAVRLECELASDLPMLTGDFDRLQQVLINLISNAAKFTDEGRVVVSASALGSGVQFSVMDTGIGIEPMQHRTIFEKFRQLGDTLTSRPRGTGLGLPICEQIVTAHDGRIWVESESGEGARFTFVIPTSDTEGEFHAIAGFEALVRRIERRVGIPASGEGKEVLVVDDDANLRELLRQQLTEEGFRVRQAVDGYDAVEKVRTKRPDIVILDVMMPQLSGFDVAALLKSDPKTADLPIIMLTIVQDQERGLSLGVDRYLNKPIEADVLTSAIEELLQNGTSPRRVLVVDDRRPTTSDIAAVLQSRGYQVVGTCVGADCIDEARRTHPNIIIFESLASGQQDLMRTIRFERGLRQVLVVELVETR